MNPSAKSNISSDPDDAWARHVVGTPIRYRVIQLMFVGFAIAIIVFFLAASFESPRRPIWWVYVVCGGVFVLNGAVVWPLLLLRALRGYVPPADAPRGFDVVTTEGGGTAAH